MTIEELNKTYDIIIKGEYEQDVKLTGLPEKPFEAQDTRITYVYRVYVTEKDTGVVLFNKTVHSAEEAAKAIKEEYNLVD